MSLLYKKQEDIIYDVDIKKKEGKLELNFSCDCGKFGTDEMLDEFELTPLELLNILQKHFYED